MMLLQFSLWTGGGGSGSSEVLTSGLNSFSRSPSTLKRTTYFSLTCSGLNTTNSSSCSRGVM